MKTRIHVNRQEIARNVKNGTDNPCITAKTYKGNRYGKRAQIIYDGKVIAEVVQSMDKPLNCGARVWIETEYEVRVHDGETK